MEVELTDVVIEKLKSPDALPNNSVLDNIKGPLLEFLKAQPEEKAEMLSAELKLATKASLLPGVGRFEALLNSVGLGGPVDKAVSRLLLELSEVRHVIVHRSGIIDKRLVARCPWFKEKVNSKILISQKMVRKYLSASNWYFLEIHCRSNSFTPPATRSDAIRLQNNILSSL